jgi:hypothetical protein
MKSGEEFDTILLEEIALMVIHGRRNKKNVPVSSWKLLDIFPDFNKIRYFATDFRISLPYKISRKSILREPRLYMLTDGRGDGKKARWKDRHDKIHGSFT